MLLKQQSFFLVRVIGEQNNLGAVAAAVDALIARFISEFEIIIKGDFESLKRTTANRMKVEINEIRSATIVFRDRWIKWDNQTTA